MDNFRDNDDINSNTFDNLVFIPHRIFKYSFNYTNSNGDKLIPVVLFNSDCFNNKEINCTDWENQHTTELNYNTSWPIEYMELYVYQTKGHNSLSDSQTIIRYDYYNKRGKILYGEQTGVVENAYEIFLHPPRMFGFVITEFNPFPMIQFQNDTWKNQISISENMLKKAKLFNKDFAIFDVTYNKCGQENLNLINFGEIKCTKIVGVSTGSMGDSQLIAYFNPNLGFVRFEYTNIDSSTLSIELEEIRMSQ